MHYSSKFHIPWPGRLDSKFKIQNSGNKTGFTLLEVMLVLSLISIVVVLGSGSLFSGRRVQTELDSASGIMVGMLRRAQNNAVTGEGFTTWGVRFDNGSADFYQMFSGVNWTSGTRYEYSTLPSGVVFGFPAEGVNAEILFDVRTGKRASGANNIIIQSSSNSALKKTISISSEGKVSSD